MTSEQRLAVRLARDAHARACVVREAVIAAEIMRAVRENGNGHHGRRGVPLDWRKRACVGCGLVDSYGEDYTLDCERCEERARKRKSRAGLAA